MLNIARNTLNLYISTSHIFLIAIISQYFAWIKLSSAYRLESKSGQTQNSITVIMPTNMECRIWMLV